MANFNDQRRVNSKQTQHAVVISNTGRAPIVPTTGTNLNAANVASVPALHVTNPLQRVTKG